MKWKPEEYQRRAIRFLLERSHGGLFLDPGLGKTSITLAVLSVFRERNLTRGTLIVAPLRVVHEVWPEEINKWADFAGTRYAILHGSKKGEALREEADVYLINPEGLPWLFYELSKMGRSGKLWPFDTLVIDESTKFKRSNTQRFKLLRPFLPRFARRYILTGSPAPNGLLDLFGQMYIVDLGKSLGPYITHYRDAFFDSGGFGGFEYTPKVGAEEAIYEAIAPYILRMSQEEYLKLPPLVNVTRSIHLPDEARRQYDNMEENFMLWLDEGKVNAKNAAVVGGKLRQIANGAVYLDPEFKPGVRAPAKRKTAAIHEAKCEALEELLDELSGQPTLVAYEFDHDLEHIQTYLAKAGYKDVPFIKGGLSVVRFREIKEAWNRGELPVILAQFQSVSHGLNLQKTGRAVIWYSIPWDLELYFQFIRRIWRRGVATRVMNYHLVAKDTTDEMALDRLGEKRKTEVKLLDAIRDYHRKRRGASRRG